MSYEQCRTPFVCRHALLGRTIALLALLLSSSAALAVDRYWKVPGGSWFQPNLWDPFGVPSPGDVAYIGYDRTSSIDSTGAVCHYLVLGLPTGFGKVGLAGSLSEYAGFVGYQSTGSLTQFSGTHSVSTDLYIGYSPGVSGYYTLNSGSLTSSKQYLGYYGTGTLTHTGGTNTITSTIYVGYYADGSGTYNLSGTGSVNTPLQYVGYYGTGAFNQSGGTNSATNCLYLAYDSGSLGTYNLTSGSLSAATESIGHAAQGTFVQSGGTNAVTGLIRVGSSSGSHGSYQLQDGALSSQGASVGYAGRGTFVHSGGTNTISQNLYLGYNPTGDGTYTQSGGTLTAAGEYVGNAGDGTFTQSGGVNSITSSTGLVLANGPVEGTYELVGGTLVLKALKKGVGTAAFNFGGGTLQANGKLVTSLPMTLTGINGNANVDTAGYSIELSGALSGDGGLDKLGDGILVLGSTNTYRGDTNVNNGELLLTGSLYADGHTFVHDAATLRGSGAAGNITVNSGGHIAPGLTVGKLSLAGDLTLNAGALLDFDLNTVLASDLIAMPSSALNLNGQDFADFIFHLYGGFGVGTYTLIDAGSVAGSLGWRSGLLGGYGAWLEVAGDNLLLHVNVVPEPGSLLVWSLVVPAVFGARRYRKGRR